MDSKLLGLTWIPILARNLWERETNAGNPETLRYVDKTKNN